VGQIEMNQHVGALEDKQEIEQLRTMLDAKQAEIDRLRTENENLQRWKALNKPLTAAMVIATNKIERLQAYFDEAVATLEKKNAEIERLRAEHAGDQQRLFHYERVIAQQHADFANQQEDSEANKDPSDLVWGAPAIGEEIGRTASQVYHLYAIGALDGAVSKMGHKTFVGSRRKLRDLPFRKLKLSSGAVKC
jgi:hypothetical protein